MKQPLLLLFLAAALASCNSLAVSAPTAAPSVSTPEVADTPEQTSAPELMPTPESSVNPSLPAQSFSSDKLGICFLYPQGYIEIPSGDSVEIVAPGNPGSDTRGLFWLEISNAYGRTAQTIADQDMTTMTGMDVGRSTLTVGGEPAVVLDGMPGQDLQRRVYVVRGETLYILAFMPTRSQNKATNDQMELLYTVVTGSWAWSPCAATQ